MRVRITHLDLLNPAEQRRRDLEALARFGSPALRSAVTEKDLQDPKLLALLRRAGHPGREPDYAAIGLRLWSPTNG